MFLKRTEFPDGEDSKLYWILYDNDNNWLASFNKRGSLTTGTGANSAFASVTVKYLKRARKL